MQLLASRRRASAGEHVSYPAARKQLRITPGPRAQLPDDYAAPRNVAALALASGCDDGHMLARCFAASAAYRHWKVVGRACRLLSTEFLAWRRFIRRRSYRARYGRTIPVIQSAI